MNLEMTKGVKVAIEKAEELGWNCREDSTREDLFIEMSKFSPKGEDFSIHVMANDLETLQQELRDKYYDFDADLHANNWFNVKDTVRGVPQSLEALLLDARSIDDMLEELKDAIADIEEDEDDEDA